MAGRRSRATPSPRAQLSHGVLNVAIRESLRVALLPRRDIGYIPAAGGLMYAIVYKADGFPICRQVPGVSPDPVVTWMNEAAAKAFISSKGGDADFQPLELTDDAMDKLAKTMGCPVQSMTFEPYPG